MQIKIYKAYDIKDKLKTRTLYEENFDVGKNDFIDYYYEVIIKRNEIVALEDDQGEVISMIHLNPYLYSIMGLESKVHYLVAVATKRAFRGQGYMKMTMDAALNYLKSLNEPFCYIMPDTRELITTYVKCGFEVVTNFNIDKFSKDKYDVYPVYTDEYIELMKKEKYFLDLETEEYKKDLMQKMVMFKVFNYDMMGCKSIDELKNKSIYVCQEV